MRFTIKTKLALAFGLVIVLAVGVGAVAIADLGTLSASINALIDGPAARVQVAEDLQGVLLASARVEKNVLLVSAGATQDAWLKDLEKLRDKASAMAEQLRSLSAGDAMQSIDALVASMGRLSAIQDQIADLAREDSQARAVQSSQHSVQDAFDASASPLQALAAQQDTGSGNSPASSTALLAARTLIQMQLLQRLEKDIVIATDDKAITA